MSESTSILSPKFQVVIPKQVRSELNLEAGQRFQVFAREGRVELVPLLEARDLRGALRLSSTETEESANDESTRLL